MVSDHRSTFKVGAVVSHLLQGGKGVSHRPLSSNASTSRQVSARSWYLPGLSRLIQQRREPAWLYHHKKQLKLSIPENQITYDSTSILPNLITTEKDKNNVNINYHLNVLLSRLCQFLSFTVLKAINEDSPTVPTLLTDYILKVLCPT